MGKKPSKSKFKQTVLNNVFLLSYSRDPNNRAGGIIGWGGTFG